MYDYPTSGCLCVKSSDQSIPNATITGLTWIEYEDNGGFFDATSNTLIVIPHSMAAVQLSAQVQFAANAGERRMVRWEKGDGSVITGLAGTFVAGPSSPSRGRPQAICPPIQVSSGDLFRVIAYQDTGAALNAEADADTWVAALKVDSLYGALVAMETSVFSVAGSSVLDYVEWDTEVYDTGSFWNASSPSMFYFWNGSVSYARFYAGVQWSTSNGHDTFLNVDKNGASFPGGGALEHVDIGAAVKNRMSLVSAVVAVSSGDYFEVQVRHSGAANLNVETGGHSYFAFEVVDDG